MIGLSLNLAMSRIIVSVNAWGTAAAPEYIKTKLHINLFITWYVLTQLRILNFQAQETLL